MSDEKPKETCPYDPREMAGLPIGMFHCPMCGEMVIAGMEHIAWWDLDEMIENDDLWPSADPAQQGPG